MVVHGGTGAAGGAVGGVVGLPRCRWRGPKPVVARERVLRFSNQFEGEEGLGGLGRVSCCRRGLPSSKSGRGRRGEGTVAARVEREI